jgi:hypothetical protein
MNKLHQSLRWMVLTIITFTAGANAFAQDDLYYDPATDVRPTTSRDDYGREESNVTRRYNDDDEYYEEDDYAYEYSSRIRRFHRPGTVVDYYDPYYVDLWNYDPFFMPGTTIYTYGFNDYWSWRRWRRYQRFNNWGAWNSWNTGWGVGWNSWGWNSCNVGWNSWNNPWVFNNYYYDPYWTWNGFNPYYCNNNVWVNNNYYYNNNNNGWNGGGNGGGYQPKTYTGTRRHGTTNSGFARINSGSTRMVAVDEKAPSIDLRRTGATQVGSNRTRETEATDRVNSRGGSNPTTPSRRPTDGVRDNTTTRGEQKNDRVEDRNGRSGTEPATRTGREKSERRPDETRPSRETERRPAETRPNRETERRPAETRPNRGNEERSERPSRNSGVEERSNRPSREAESRPSRTQERSERPSRSNDGGGRSMDNGGSRGGSERSSGGSNSGGGGRGGDSGGSRGGSSGGGRGGRG